MNALLILILLCAGAAGLSLALKCRAEQGLVLLTLGLVCGGYVLALAGLLRLTGFLLWGAGALGGAFVLYTLLRGRTKELRALAGGLILFAAAALVLWWLCRGCALSDWDDFSHWGSSLKITVTTDLLYTAPDSPDAFKSYPPAAVLWEQLLLRAAGTGYREDLALFFHGLLTLIPLLWPLSAIPVHRFGNQALTFGALCALVWAIYPRGLYMLGVDVLLGVFTALLLWAEFLPQRSRGTSAVQVMGCFVLTLLKSSGFGLALMVCIAVLLHRLSLRRASLRLPIGMTCAALAAKFSWGWHLAAMEVHERWQADTGLLAGLSQMLSGTAPDYRKALPGSFWESIFSAENYGTRFRFSFAVWFAVLAVLGVAAVLLTQRKGRKTAAAGFVAAGGIGAVYVLSLLVTYLFYFSEGEASSLASVSRYLATCAVFMGLFGLGAAAVAAARQKTLVRLLPALLLAAALCLVSHPGYLAADLLEAPIHAAQTNHDAYLARRAAQRIRSLGEDDPRLYLITANDAGIAQLRIRYELLPLCIPESASILMTDAENPDPWVKLCSWQDWRQELLNGYDYVYIYCPEDQFVREFWPVFIDESQAVVDRMFRVVDTGGDAILETMPEITADPQPAV